MAKIEKKSQKQCSCGVKSKPPLDILAQLRKTESEGDFSFNQTTDAYDRKTLNKRARAKYLSMGLVMKLVQLDSPLKQSYWNTYHCSEMLVKNNQSNTIRGKYCKNRWCLVCNRIRTAECVKKYLPVIEDWDDKHMVTLTVPNCKGELLEDTIKKMEQDFKRIQEVMRKRGQLMIGIRKMECTYNPVRNDFHPHYHILVNGQSSAEEIKSQWLERNPSARDIAQDVTKADDKSIRELFKYFTKIISGKPEDMGGRKIQVVALDIIFRTIAGKRTFQSFGFKLPKTVEEQSEQQVQAEEFAEESMHQWVQEVQNWVNVETGEIEISNYIVGERYKALVESIEVVPIDIDESAFLKKPKPPKPKPPKLYSHSMADVLDAISA